MEDAERFDFFPRGNDRHVDCATPFIDRERTITANDRRDLVGQTDDAPAPLTRWRRFKQEALKRNGKRPAPSSSAASCG
ncbi:hypothetical protein [Burkholderia mayonis]|uniref:hypothetical protein n=1 Tax=Burkholderia mayonis TaxID=1385591 RepID=UPI00131ED5C6|nr:hypothetical protein [Burkholderia mayonis]